MTRLGISSSRVFNVGELPETMQSKPSRSLETALPLQVNSTCNAVMTKQSVDDYSVESKQDQRIVVDAAAQGIDSVPQPVWITAER